MEIFFYKETIGSKSDDGKYEIILCPIPAGRLIRQIETKKTYICVYRAVQYKPGKKHALETLVEFTATIYGKQYLCYEFKDDYKHILNIEDPNDMVSIAKQMFEILERDDLITIEETRVYFDVLAKKIIIFDAIYPKKASTYYQIIYDLSSM